MSHHHHLVFFVKVALVAGAFLATSRLNPRQAIVQDLTHHLQARPVINTGAR